LPDSITEPDNPASMQKFYAKYAPPADAFAPFHGQTSWGDCPLSRFFIPLESGGEL
jgi:hypothetical protein